MRRWFRPLAYSSIVVISAVAFVRLVFVREAARRRLFPLLRPLYKHVFNPSALRAAAHGDTRWGVLHHVGRRSGMAYDTPIDVQPTPEGVLISLVYGSGADWCRNVLAAGHCTLTLNGKDLALTAPRIVPLSDAQPLLSPERAGFWRSMGIEHCLALKIAPRPEMPTVMDAINTAAPG